MIRSALATRRVAGHHGAADFAEMLIAHAKLAETVEEVQAIIDTGIANGCTRSGGRYRAHSRTGCSAG